MFKNLDLYTQRYIQIIIVIVIAQIIYEYLYIPHSIWVLITIVSVYSGFHPHDVLKRANSRVYGTIIGVGLIAIIWYLVHWDFRLLIILTTLLIPTMVFFSSIPYKYSVIFSTVLSDIIKEWSNSSSFNLMYYINDRIICTFIAFGICTCIEYFWFGSQNLTYLNARQTQSNILKHTQQLFHLAKSGAKSNKIFNITNILLKEISQLNSLVVELKSENNPQNKNLELQKLNTEIENLANKIISLNYINSNKIQLDATYNLTLEIERDLSQISLKLS